uniref:Atp8 n=1 Tax=Sepiadarium austrinum TaxID=279093 RepID=A0A1W5WWJ5_9MOLL|nr:atp8 [Sepiadarium austrinum]
MPQLSPINWTFLFMMFWSTMIINTSIMWWNTSNIYTINKNTKTMTKMSFNW